MSAIPVVTQPIPVVSVYSPEIVSILKRAPSFFSSEGVTVETVDKCVKFRHNRPKDKNKIDNSDEIDSESKSAAIKHSAKKRYKKWLYPEKYAMAILPYYYS